MRGEFFFLMYVCVCLFVAFCFFLIACLFVCAFFCLCIFFLCVFKTKSVGRNNGHSDQFLVVFPFFDTFAFLFISEFSNTYESVSVNFFDFFLVFKNTFYFMFLKLLTFLERFCLCVSVWKIFVVSACVSSNVLSYVFTVLRACESLLVCACKIFAMPVCVQNFFP